MRTWVATPEDKQGTYSAPQARSDNRLLATEI
jgi:hypothetical protein